MEFIQQPYQPGETIAAIATPPGEGGVAMIRISGSRAIDVAELVFSGAVRKYKSHTAHYGKIQDKDGKKIDDVLILPMIAPKSYTGEDTVEIFCHGGGLITRQVLEVVIAAGARAAMPGEFTFKAFMNGKLDLAQAEAVQELIGAKSELALEAAEKQLDGSLSEKVRILQEKLTLVAAILEAWVDFPDEGLEFATMDETIEGLNDMSCEMERLIATFHEGKILHDGLSLCLIGSPNVGKSSLMNALLDKERAIVSEIAGTTRDIVEDNLRLNGLNFRILDTAGIRETEELIEKEGIRRTHHAMQEADLILVVLDVQNKEQIPTFLERIPKDKAVLVWNKSDLPHADLPTYGFPHHVVLSALKKTGIESLKKEIDAVIWKDGPPSKNEVIVTNVRHKEALQNAKNELSNLIQGLKTGVSPEFLTLEMRGVLSHLGRILGTDISEDIITAIFSKFCIGK